MDSSSVDQPRPGVPGYAPTGFLAPPPGWHPPLVLHWQPVFVPPPRRRRTRLVLAIVAVVLLIAGVTTWIVWPKPPDRSPFEQAVSSLATEPVAHYSAELSDGMTWDSRVTSHGDLVGWIGDNQIKFPVLVVGGKEYVKEPNGTQVPGSATHLGAELIKDKWLTGDLGDLVPVLKQEIDPSALAARMRDALAKTPKLPGPDDPGTVVDDVPVLTGDTPGGTIYVARSAPYRVVRWVENTSHVTTAAFVGSHSGQNQLDFTPMTADAVDQTYDELETDTSQLGDAVDASVKFTVDSLDHGMDIKACGDNNCVVTANITATPRPGMTPPAQVTAKLTANVALNDVPSGSCTSTAKVASSGSSSISCTDRDSAAGYQQADSTAKSSAEAKATPGTFYTWYVEAKADVVVFALADVDVVGQQRQLEAYRPHGACGWTEQGGTGKTAITLYDKFSARIDTARAPDFEIRVYDNGDEYGFFGSNGWFSKNGSPLPSRPPARLESMLADVAVAYMRQTGRLSPTDPVTSWRRPAPPC